MLASKKQEPNGHVKHNLSNKFGHTPKQFTYQQQKQEEKVKVV
jgi:hypothetical protein